VVMFFALFPLAVQALHFGVTKEAAFAEALELSQGRGIINLGCGPHRTYWAQDVAAQSDVLVNVDIVPDGMPHFLQLDIEQERLPFLDKQFGCAFASHVLEHLDSWEFALGEMARVSDYVVVVLPDVISFAGWIDPDHRRHFSIEDMQSMVDRYPSVKVFC